MRNWDERDESGEGCSAEDDFRVRVWWSCRGAKSAAHTVLPDNDTT
jgi:hypothetical protein